MKQDVSFVQVHENNIDLLSKVIAFHPELARRMGSIEAAILYQQLFYWSTKGKRDDGFIYKTKQEIEEETTLTSKQQDRVRALLVRDKWIETKLVKANGSPTLHYRVLVDLAFSIIPKGHNPIYPNGIIQYDKREDSITENTTESTTDITLTNVSVRKNGSNEPPSQKLNIQPLLALFEPVNPSYEKLFSNTTQRKSLESLVKKHGYESIERTIKALPGVINKPYAPRITTPLALENDLGKLIAFVRQTDTKSKKPIRFISNKKT